MLHLAQVHYVVQINSLAGHLFNITQTIYHPGDQDVIVSLPAWIPGSYMIRDFAKNIIQLKAYDGDGNNLTALKLDKQTWKITPKGESLRIETQVYAYDLSVRSAYMNDEYAFFNGTSVFLRWHGYSGKCSLDIQLPEHKISNWQIATAMKCISSTKKSKLYEADNYDELIDHPVLMGELNISSFNVLGVEFKFVLTGNQSVDTKRICDDLSLLCEHHLNLFNDGVPITEYWFMTLLCHAGFGGLEHRASTVLQFARSELPTLRHAQTMPDGYRTFLSLCSHEFFHTWHVKRNKPDVFMQLDLSKEVYTEQLWIYEGFTSYFDDLSLVRTGLIEPQSYLELLGQTLTRLRRNPGNLKQTVTESSFDAWTRFYQQDANAANSIVSYYAKGAEIALCLDLKIRQASNHQASLFDLVRLLWQNFGLVQMGTQFDSIQNLLKQQLHIDLDEFLDTALYTTQALPTAQLLRDFGVDTCFRPKSEPNDKGGKPSDITPKIGFGATYEESSLGVKINQVLEASPAYHAGLFVGDILISVQNWQVNKLKLQSILDDYAQSKHVMLHVLRDGRLVQLDLPIMVAEENTVYLQTVDPETRDRWLMTPLFESTK